MLSAGPVALATFAARGSPQARAIDLTGMALTRRGALSISAGAPQALMLDGPALLSLVWWN